MSSGPPWLPSGVPPSLRSASGAAGSNRAAPGFGVARHSVARHSREDRTKTAKAYLKVRTVLADAADRPSFDRWHEAEHLPDAVARLGTQRGWRRWHRTDPSVHHAFHGIAEITRTEAVLASPELRTLVAEFDRAWGGRAARSGTRVSTEMSLHVLAYIMKRVIAIMGIERLRAAIPSG